MTETKKDQQWLDSFTLELAHRGVSGRDIGDAKASVESHLADSGEIRRGRVWGSGGLCASPWAADLIIGAGFWTRASVNSSEGIVRPTNAGVPEQETAVERAVVAAVPWLMAIGAGIFTAGAFLTA